MYETAVVTEMNLAGAALSAMNSRARVTSVSA